MLCCFIWRCILFLLSYPLLAPCFGEVTFRHPMSSGHSWSLWYLKRGTWTSDIQSPVSCVIVQFSQVAEAEWVSDGEKGINTPLKLVAAGWDAWKSFYCPWCWLNLLSLFPETQALSPLELKWLMLLRWWVGILFDSGTPFDHDKLSSESDIESGPVALKLLLMSKLSSCHLCISELPLGAIVCVHAREGLCVWVFFRLLPLTVYHVSM